MALNDAVDAVETGKNPKATVDVDAHGADVKNVIIEGDLNGDWGRLLRHFNLDPDHFEVVDDTVRMSTWEQSARSKSGDRDKVQLWSYSARFRRINKQMIRPQVFEDWRLRLLDDVVPAAHVEVDGAYVILVADPQLGKKGTEEAVENWKRGINGHIDRIRKLKPSSIVCVFMGDETEGVCNNYTNQPHTIELNQSQQLELDFDLRVWTIKRLRELGLPLTVGSVISNHGEWTRNGSKDPVTTRNDNASTHIARQVRKLFDEIGANITWVIGDGKPGITITIDGVDCYFSHGYVEKGRGSSSELRTKNAIERQIVGRTEELGSTKLWFMAHYHHFYTNEFEGRTLFGCPALEAEKSSEYMLDQYGVWSPPGLLGMIVTSKSRRGYQHVNVF